MGDHRGDPHNRGNVFPLQGRQRGPNLEILEGRLSHGPIDTDHRDRSVLDRFDLYSETAKKALANMMLGFGGLSVLYTLGHGLGVLNFQWGFDGLDAAPGIITEKTSTLLLGFWMMLLGSMPVLAAGIFAFRLNAKREKEIDAQIKDR